MEAMPWVILAYETHFTPEKKEYRERHKGGVTGDNM